LKTGFRAFYYSAGRKIASDARLLLGLPDIKASDNYWKIEEWTSTDLSNLDVRLKAEYNAINCYISEESTLARSCADSELF